MANIKINTTELKAILDMTPADQNLMLTGEHGIGKSETLTEYFAGKGMKVVPLFLGQMSDPGDLIGIPSQNESTGKTDFMPPYWFPLDGKPIVLFLDELNRARPEVLQTIMDLALNRRLAGRELPEGSRIIAAVNEGDQYQLTDLDPALVSRFNVYSFQPTSQEWLLWAEKAGVDGRVRRFIEDNSLWLDRNPDQKENDDTGLDKTPDRRAWKRVSDVIRGTDTVTLVHQKMIAGIVGPKAALAFSGSIAERKIFSGKEILYRFDEIRDRLDGYELHELTQINDGIFRHLEVEVLTGKEKEKAKKNVEGYFDFLSKKKKDAAAHFASLYMQQTYPHAVAFIARECQVLTMSIVIYAKSIR